MNQEPNVQVVKALGWKECACQMYMDKNGSKFSIPAIPDFSGDPTAFFKYVVPEIRKRDCDYNYDGEGFEIRGVYAGENWWGYADDDKIAEAGCEAFLKMMEEKL